MEMDNVGYLTLLDAIHPLVISVLDVLWILKPKINDDVPIRNDTAVRILLVRPGTIVSGAPVLVLSICCAFMR